MFRPDSAHLLVSCEFAAIRLREGLVQRRLFFGTELKQGLVFAGELQEHASEFVLYFRRKAAYRLDSLFEQFGHAWTIELLLAARKGFEGNRNRGAAFFMLFRRAGTVSSTVIPGHGLAEATGFG
jgi:predicted ATP-dependent serine protease